MGFGFSTFGAAAFFEGYRLWSLIGAFLLLGLGFYLDYLRKEPCREDGTCEPSNSRFLLVNRVLLWASTAIVLAFALFPSYVGVLPNAAYVLAAAEERGISEQAPATAERIIPIEGMTCTGCEAGVKQALVAVPGVLEAEVSYSQNRANLQIDTNSPPSQLALSAAVARAGYQIGAVAASTSSRAAGQWQAEVESDGRQIEIILDIGTLNGTRWIGEIDIPKEGLEDYPLEVEVWGDSLSARFGSLFFKGLISEDGSTYTVVLEVGDESETVELHRIGDPDFSETFLQLEAVADDPDAVRHLSANGEELREQFNEDSDKVRLLMLLAPS
jgi:copper chaperone CopZ